MSAVIRYLLIFVLSLTAGLALAQDGRPNRPRNLLELALLPEVQRELRLDENRASQLDQANIGMSQKAEALWKEVLKLSHEERDRRFQAFRAEQERKVEEILDRRQMNRLRQLDYQLWGIRALIRKDVQDCLRLSPEQRGRVQSTMQSEHEAMREKFQGFRGGMNLTPEQREELQRKIAEVRDLHSQTDSRLIAILTEPQQRKWTAMQGQPFRFPDFRRKPGG